MNQKPESRRIEEKKRRIKFVVSLLFIGIVICVALVLVYTSFIRQSSSNSLLPIHKDGIKKDTYVSPSQTNSGEPLSSTFLWLIIIFTVLGCAAILVSMVLWGQKILKVILVLFWVISLAIVLFIIISKDTKPIFYTAPSSLILTGLIKFIVLLLIKRKTRLHSRTVRQEGVGVSGVDFSDGNGGNQIDYSTDDYNESEIDLLLKANFTPFESELKSEKQGNPQRKILNFFGEKGIKNKKRIKEWNDSYGPYREGGNETGDSGVRDGDSGVRFKETIEINPIIGLKKIREKGMFYANEGLDDFGGLFFTKKELKKRRKEADKMSKKIIALLTKKEFGEAYELGKGAYEDGLIRKNELDFLQQRAEFSEGSDDEDDY